MKKSKILFLLLAVLFLAITKTSAAQDPDSAAQMPSITLPPALDRVLRDYEKAWRQRDASALAGRFAQDGFVLSPGRVPVRGRWAIEERYKNAGGPLVLRALAYATADSVGYIIGAYSRQEGEADIGKFVLALCTDQTGRWMIAADMDNSNQP